MSVPAKPGAIEMTLPDGSTISITIHGDENFSYYMTTDGHALAAAPDGYLCYLTTDATGRAVRSDVRAHDLAQRCPQEISFTAAIDAEAVAKSLSRERAASMRRAPAKANGMLTDYPTIGSPNAMVILVEFTDEKFHTENANAEFSRLMMERGYAYGGATGSARDYYEDNSSGLFTPNFEVFGPITLPYHMAHYGAPTANAHDTAPWEMVADACRVLKETQPEVDFSRFDNDHDGVVDNIFVFYAGYGENSGAPVNTIWPHAANLSWYGLSTEYDGVKIDNYACSCELQGNKGLTRTGIGTFCHEFGHVLGLPDFYSTEYNSAFTPNDWDLMDTGCYNNNGNTPPLLCAYNRFTLKWLNPRELTAPETVQLADISSNEAFLITTAKEEEYYLLENRQLVSWDQYLPGHGMLIWHIDYDKDAWKSNSVNNRPSHQRIDIIEADGTQTKESRGGDTFPGRSNVTEFTDDSSPAMTTWTGIRVNKPITDIREVDGVISFKIMGGGDGIAKVVATEASDVTPQSFRANWEGNVTIKDYEIDLCHTGEVIPFMQVTKSTKSTTECYYDFSGLEPSSSYYYVVRAVDGAMKSANSNTVTVMTLDPTFDMLATVATEATNVKANSVTAIWEETAGAEAYLLDVYQKEYLTPVYDTVDFTGGISEMPQGWATNSTSTSAVAGSFGESRPSLMFKTAYDNITSPTYDFDINGLRFWYSGNSAVKGVLAIEGLVGGAWLKIADIALNEATSATTIDLNNNTDPAIPLGCRAIRLTFNREAGTLYIDDIAVAYNGQADYIYADGFESRNVGNVTSYNIDGLKPSTAYFFRVTAISGDLKAISSDEIAFTTDAGSGISDLHKPDALEIKAVSGGVSIKAGVPTRITVCTPDGCIIKNICASNAVISLSKGIYIVNDKKVVVR